MQPQTHCSGLIWNDSPAGGRSIPTAHQEKHNLGFPGCIKFLNEALLKID